MPQIYLDIDATGSVKGIRQYEDATDRGAKATGKLTKSAKKGFSGIAKAATAASAVASAAIAAIATVSVKTFADFDDQVRMAAATAGATASEFIALADAAKEAGASTRYAASESAEALTLLAQRGFDVTQAIAAMPEVLSLAAANQIALADATSVATGVLRGFGKEVKDLNDINDVLTATSQKSGANVIYLGDAFKYAAPAAKGSREELESASAVIGALADNAFAGGEAGNAYKRMLIALQAPTASQAAAQDRLNLTVHDSLGNFVGLIPILEQLQKKNIDLVDSYRLFGAYTATAGLAASSSADRIRTLYGELKSLDDVTRKTAEFQEEGLGGALRSLGSATEAVSIAIGESLAPVIQDIAEDITAFNRELSQSKTFALNIIDPVSFIAISLTSVANAADIAIDGLSGLVAFGAKFTPLYRGIELVAGGLEAIGAIDSNPLKDWRKDIEQFAKEADGSLGRSEKRLDSVTTKFAGYRASILAAGAANKEIEPPEGIEKTSEELDKAKEKAENFISKMEEINSTRIAVDINAENKPALKKIDEIERRIQDINKEYVLNIDTNPEAVKALGIEFIELEKQLVKQKSIVSTEQQIKDLDGALKEIKQTTLDGKITINADPEAAAALESQIWLLKQQRAEIVETVPQLELVNGVWRNIKETVEQGAQGVANATDQATASTGQLEQVVVSLDGVWTQALSNGADLLRDVNGELITGQQAAIQYAASVATIGESNEGISDAQKILDDIYNSMTSIPDVSGKFEKLVDSKAALEILKREISGLKKLMKSLDPASEAAAKAIASLMTAEAAEKTLKKEVKELEEEIDKTGKTAEKTAKKIKKIPKAAEAAAASIGKIAEANEAVSSSAQELEKTQGDIARAAWSASKTFEATATNDIASIDRKIEKLKEEEEIISRMNDIIFGKQSDFTGVNRQARDKTMGQEQIQDLESKKFALQMEKTINNFMNSTEANRAALNKNTSQLEEGGRGSARGEQMGTVNNNFNMSFKGMGRDDVVDIQSDLERMTLRK